MIPTKCEMVSTMWMLLQPKHGSRGWDQEKELRQKWRLFLQSFGRDSAPTWPETQRPHNTAEEQAGWMVTVALTLCKINQESPVTFLFTPTCTCPMLVNNLVWKRMPKKLWTEDGWNCSISSIIYSLYYAFIVMFFYSIFFWMPLKDCILLFHCTCCNSNKDIPFHNYAES